MGRLESIDDTIVAISTATGQGGIGIVRMSGRDSLSIADQLFIAKNKTRPSHSKSFTVHYGWVVNRRKAPNKKHYEIIDEVLLTVMHSPKSYTKEDMVEISCHGGIIPLRTILIMACDFGARLAEPGEFTKRAFLNGRIDLTQAEAVLDIIQAKTDAFLRISTNQLKGSLLTELEAIREQLMHVYTEMEAIINFPEDTIKASGRRQFIRHIQLANKRIRQLLQSSEQGRILKEGINIVFCGNPNVGKSSLFNVLLKQSRSIVTEIPGTTRDTIEESAQIKGIPFQMVDTAGILEPRDLVEQEAVKRSRMHIQRADLVLLVLDGNQALSLQDEVVFEKIRKGKVIIVINKCDLSYKIDECKLKKLFGRNEIVKVSALKKIAIKKLEDAIVGYVWQGGAVNTQEVLVSNVRHISALKKCAGAIEKGQQTLVNGVSLEFASEEIKDAISYLDKITGRDIDSDLLDKIFSGFCIGK